MRTRAPSTTTVPDLRILRDHRAGRLVGRHVLGVRLQLDAGQRRHGVCERLADDPRHGHLGLPGRHGQRHLRALADGRPLDRVLLEDLPGGDVGVRLVHDVRLEVVLLDQRLRVRQVDPGVLLRPAPACRVGAGPGSSGRRSSRRPRGRARSPTRSARARWSDPRAPACRRRRRSARGRRRSRRPPRRRVSAVASLAPESTTVAASAVSLPTASPRARARGRGPSRSADR